MWKNIVICVKPQTKMWLMHIANWIPKATHTHTHTEYVMLVVLQGRVFARTRLNVYMYIACLVMFFYSYNYCSVRAVTVTVRAVTVTFRAVTVTVRAVTVTVRAVTSTAKYYGKSDRKCNTCVGLDKQRKYIAVESPRMENREEQE
jgi:hypothetical protein